MLIDLLATCQQIVKFRLPQHTAQGSLGELTGGIKVVFHLDDGLIRAYYAKIEHRIDLHRDIVLGDNILGRHIHGHGTQTDFSHPVHHRNDEAQPRPLDRRKPAETKHHATLVFQNNTHRTAENQQDQNYDDNRKHHVASFRCAQAGSCYPHSLQKPSGCCSTACDTEEALLTSRRILLPMQVTSTVSPRAMGMAA